MQLLDAPRERATHDQPGDDFRTLHAATFSVPSLGDEGERKRVIDQQIQELRIPLGIVETTAFTVHLMGNTAGGNNGNFQVLGVTLDCTTQGLSQLVAAQRAGNRELEHANLQRHDLDWPAFTVWQQCRHR
ncbi:hypothetical protein D3C77_469490 [compost metagenome]